MVDYFDMRPISVVIARLRPAAFLQPRVISFAMIDFRHQDRPGARLPILIGPHNFLTAVFVFDLNLYQQRQPVTIEIRLPAKADVAAIPAIAEDYANGILATAQQIGEVVSLILQALVIAGPTRRENLIANTLPVQMHLVQTVARHISPRFLYHAFGLEGAAQQWRRLWPRNVFLQVRLYPARLPVRSWQ